MAQRYSCRTDGLGFIITHARGPHECMGFKTSIRLKRGANVVRALGGDCAALEGRMFKFEGHDQLYEVEREKDYDRKQDIGLWIFKPLLKTEVFGTTAIIFNKAIPDGFEEITQAEFDEIKDIDIDMVGPRWKRVNGANREVVDIRKFAKFTNGQPGLFDGLPAGAWDEDTKLLYMKHGAIGATIDFHVLDGAGDTDQSYNEEIDLKSDDGNHIFMKFQSGITKLDVGTDIPGKLTFANSTVFRVKDGLELIVRSVQKLQIRNNG